MAEHAMLSASGAYRWMACTKSARFETQFPDSSSVYALEGTIAHGMAEKSLKAEIPAIEVVLTDEEMQGLKLVFPSSEDLEKEIETMARYVQEYVDYVMAIPGARFIEQRVDFSHIVPEGFGTSDAIVIHGDTAEIVDLKYGKGKQVFADGPQAKLYAIGAIKEYAFLFDGIKNIRLHIVQPRLNHVDVHEMTMPELVAFAKEVKARAALAYKGEGDYVAGAHCDFCRAKAVCAERARANLAIAQEEFGEPCPTADRLTLAQIGDLLPRLDDIVKWAGDVKEYALAQALDGEEIPGHKIVEGRSTRKWLDENQVAEAMRSNGLTNEQIYDMKLIGLTEAEKLLGKKSPVFDLAVRSPGKPTLVPESDKRMVIGQAAVARDFAEPVAQ